MTGRVHGKVARESLNATIITIVTRADQLSLSVPVMFGPPAFVCVSELLAVSPPTPVTVTLTVCAWPS